ncbi:hypothetical protein GCM10022381_41120 [Leifsonia kafniensis]|uniref:D-alanyl-D-alanine carboxypeptidase-like core domain-containing protein n=1 Tax=Leifsonia kafniensis TaxID=475957 RepID=A0ABP7L799_9MICO
MTSPTRPEIPRMGISRFEKPGIADPVAGPPESVLAEPVAAEALPIELVPAESSPTEPVAAEPDAGAPVRAEPALAEAAPVEPVPAEPVLGEPVLAEPALAEPVPAAIAEAERVSARVPGAPTAESTLSPRVRRNRIIAGASLALVVVVLLGVVVGNLLDAGHGAEAKPTVAAHPAGEFNRAAFSLDDPASPWVIVNKQRPIVPVDFTPPDLVEVKVAHTWKPLLRQEAAVAVETMFAAATSEAGLSLESNSAYRSYASQVEVYTEEVTSKGRTSADQSTARPGTSEHQTGLTIDIGAESGICRLNVCFADSAEGHWLAENAWRFGFLLRYPADKVSVTGYEFEPWHFRYIGTDLAAELHSTGVSTLEEFFGLPAAPTY